MQIYLRALLMPRESDESENGRDYRESSSQTATSFPSGTGDAKWNVPLTFRAPVENPRILLDSARTGESINGCRLVHDTRRKRRRAGPGRKAAQSVRRKDSQSNEALPAKTRVYASSTLISGLRSERCGVPLKREARRRETVCLPPNLTIASSGKIRSSSVGSFSL